MMVYHTKRGAALMSFLIMVNSNPGEKRHGLTLKRCLSALGPAFLPRSLFQYPPDLRRLSERSGVL